MQRERIVEGKRITVSVMEQVSVVPDGLILVTNPRTNQRLLVLLEIDQNTQAEGRFKEHIASRLAYVKSPQLRDTYGTVPYRIAYATQGLTEAASRARLAAMVKFTREVLTARQRTEDSRYFRFTTITFATLYEDTPRLFEGHAWYLPDDLTLERPVPLFTEATPRTP
jgi:hypothetical protein